MLVPAIYYKDEIEKIFAKNIYNDNYFFYTGYAGCFSLPKIEAVDDHCQWVSIDNDDKLRGYLAYRIEPLTYSVNSFGLFSFLPDEENNIVLIKDVFDKLEELVSIYHRVEWRVISGNHVKRGYDNFCKRHNGNIVCLHDVTRDKYNNYHDEYIYEIINKKR